MARRRRDRRVASRDSNHFGPGYEGKMWWARPHFHGIRMQGRADQNQLAASSSTTRLLEPPTIAFAQLVRRLKRCRRMNQVSDRTSELARYSHTRGFSRTTLHCSCLKIGEPPKNGLHFSSKPIQTGYPCPFLSVSRVHVARSAVFKGYPPTKYKHGSPRIPPKNTNRVAQGYRYRVPSSKQNPPQNETQAAPLHHLQGARGPGGADRC